MNKHLQAVHAYPLAAIDFIKAIGQIGRWLRVSSEPLAEAWVPEDYIGINIATSDDPAVDDYLVARLAELGIKHVRLDFSYDSVGGPAQRLLERLLSENLQVMLEVFPPLDEARRLFSDSTAQRRWADFLTSVFNQYQDRVEWFEIGSTPNRGRWSGFSFLSYQAAWGIAVEQARSADVILAGPNVSDFEPLYNASFLGYMKRFGRVPQLHSDNLFVERVVEPEAYDHRVLGKLATHRLKLNLLKKARVLQLIGRDHGSPETVCTYKCWTSKRLARRSPWPYQKQVDYLVRYLALAASSGALRRIYWGPLICSRDGLISDRVEGYPVIDQVSYYQQVRGELADFTITPGFHALAHAVERFADSRCMSLLHQPYGLSLYRFAPRGRDNFHLCWCRDGMAWPLEGIFSATELEQAKFFDACGQAIDRPLLINEHPIFIEFADNAVSPNLQKAYSLATPDITHLSSPTHQSISNKEGSWLGALMLRAERQAQDIETIGTLRPSVLPTLEETAVLRDARNRIWNVQDPRDNGGQVSVKLNRVAGIKRFTYRFRPSKGRRHWNNGCEMIRRGIKTPMPVAFYEQDEKPGIRDSWYLCEFIPGAFNAKDVYAAFRDGATEYRGLDKPEWFGIIAEFVCEMHNKQIVHRDLSGGNLLLRQLKDGSVEPFLIDIGRAWMGNGSGLKPRHRLQDLMRICYKLGWADREAFIRAYEAHLGKPFSALWRVPFHYYDYKQKFKKGIKGKYRKRTQR